MPASIQILIVQSVLVHVSSSSFLFLHLVSRTNFHTPTFASARAHAQQQNGKQLDGKSIKRGAWAMLEMWTIYSDACAEKTKSVQDLRALCTRYSGCSCQKDKRTRVRNGSLRNTCTLYERLQELSKAKVCYQTCICQVLFSRYLLFHMFDLWDPLITMLSVAFQPWGSFCCIVLYISIILRASCALVFCAGTANSAPSIRVGAYTLLEFKTATVHECLK